MQGDRQSVAIVGILRLQFHRAGQGEQGVFTLIMADQPEPQLVLQER